MTINSKKHRIGSKTNKFSGTSEFPILAISNVKGMDFNKSSIQANAFKIPKKVQRDLKIKTINKG